MFLGGAGRSGTTMLVDMIGHHPEISPIYETDFVIKLCRSFYQEKEMSWEERLKDYDRYAYEWSKKLPHPVWPEDKAGYERYDHGEHYINFETGFFRDVTHEFLQNSVEGMTDADLRNYVETLFARHTEMDGKKYWISKTPHYVNNLDILLKWFPECKFIHLVRHGLDTVASLKERSWTSEKVEDVIRRWGIRVSTGIRFGKRYPEKYAEVKYEKLVKHPKKTLTDLLGQLSREEGKEKTATRAREIMKEVESPDPGRIGRGRKKLGDETRRKFWQICGQVMEELNYQ